MINVKTNLNQTFAFYNNLYYKNKSFMYLSLIALKYMKRRKIIKMYFLIYKKIQIAGNLT